MLEAKIYLNLLSSTVFLDGDIMLEDINLGRQPAHLMYDENSLAVSFS